MWNVQTEELENYYQILGIEYPSNPEEIKTSYKQLVKACHPDIIPGDSENLNELLAKINFAYSVLSHKEEKENYDFLYLKYIKNEPYLKYEDSCGSSCGCAPSLDFGPETSFYNKWAIYIISILLLAALAFPLFR